MIRFSYHNTDYDTWLQEFATVLGTEVEGDTLWIPPDFGGGYKRTMRMPNGLSVIINDTYFSRDICFHRQKSQSSHFILNFDDIEIGGSLWHVVENERRRRKSSQFKAAYMFSTLFESMTITAGGNRGKSVKVIMDAAWMASHLGLAGDEEVLQKYVSLKSLNLHMEPLDGVYRQWKDEIIFADTNSPLFKTIVENRVMLLIERFFTRLYEKIKVLPTHEMDSRDIYRMMEVENALVQEYTRCQPTIESLAARFKISESTLQRHFKVVYGMPVYEYFQKYRMQQAKTMLLSGNYAVKEVGYKLGYQNLSNFANAFRKEYGVLPSELAYK